MYKIKDRLTTPILIIETEVKRDDSGRTYTAETEKTEQVWAVWKTYGGTLKQFGSTVANRGEKVNVVSYEDTAEVECYYTPFLTDSSHIQNLITGEKYSVITAPEDINQLHKFLKFKVRKMAK